MTMSTVSFRRNSVEKYKRRKLKPQLIIRGYVYGTDCDRSFVIELQVPLLKMPKALEIEPIKAAPNSAMVN